MAQNPEIVDIVQEALTVKYASFYKLWSYSVMSNHCHALIKPKILDNSEEPVGFGIIMQRLKGYTAKEANSLLGRTGQTFWQDESYVDHLQQHQQELR